MPRDVILFGLGYPVAIGVITRFVPVVRQRRGRWLAAHHGAMVAIVAGWALRGEVAPAVFNASWLAASSLWYLKGGDRPAPA